MMILPAFFLLLYRQRHEALVRQAEQVQFVRESLRTARFDVQAIQLFFWWVGGVLLSWGCVLQQKGRANISAEKGDGVCL